MRVVFVRCENAIFVKNRGCIACLQWAMLLVMQGIHPFKGCCRNKIAFEAVVSLDERNINVDGKFISQVACSLLCFM